MTAPTFPIQALIARADLLFLVAEFLRVSTQIDLPTAKEARDVAFAASLTEQSMPTTVETMVAVAAQTPRDLWTNEYTRLFEGAIACAVNEAAYIRRDKGALLSDIGGFYLAFGLVPATGTGERLDHLRCELEFLATLHFMLAQAQERGGEQDAAVTLDAMRRFVSDHLGDWVFSFCTQLRQATTLELYAHLATVIEGLITEVAVALAIPIPGDNAERAPVTDPAEWPMECGMAPSPTPCSLTINGQ